MLTKINPEENPNTILLNGDVLDHNSKTVWNGSRLSTELSTNIFNDCWNNNIKPDIKEAAVNNLAEHLKGNHLMSDSL